MEISTYPDEISKQHTIWTAGKNLALPDTLSRNTPTEMITGKTTVEKPQNKKFFFAKDANSPRLEGKYAIKDYDAMQINALEHKKFSYKRTCIQISLHTNGHAGSDKTYSSLIQNFYFPNAPIWIKVFCNDYAFPITSILSK